MEDASARSESFDSGAAVTRSLLGWGAVAGPFYLVVGVVLGATREGFSFTEHALSLLMLGDWGWVQSLNFALSGLMVLAAAVGFARAMRPASQASRVAVFLGLYGLALVASGVFRPDAVDAFPPDVVAGDPTLAGILHLAAGGVGFIALTVAAVFAARWWQGRSEPGRARASRAAAAIILAGFVGGAALATMAVGVALLWVAVVTGWAWLAVTSVLVYRTVPHPDAARRAG